MDSIGWTQYSSRCIYTTYTTTWVYTRTPTHKWSIHKIMYFVYTPCILWCILYIYICIYIFCVCIYIYVYIYFVYTPCVYSICTPFVCGCVCVYNLYNDLSIHTHTHTQIYILCILFVYTPFVQIQLIQRLELYKLYLYKWSIHKGSFASLTAKEPPCVWVCVCWVYTRTPTHKLSIHTHTLSIHTHTHTRMEYTQNNGCILCILHWSLLYLRRALLQSNSHDLQHTTRTALAGNNHRSTIYEDTQRKPLNTYIYAKRDPHYLLYCVYLGLFCVYSRLFCAKYIVSERRAFFATISATWLFYVHDSFMDNVRMTCVTDATHQTFYAWHTWDIRYVTRYSMRDTHRYSATTPE